ncbi:UNVERIFIED_ORG: hypothetical protein FHU01_4520 [Citrobacter freundii]
MEQGEQAHHCEAFVVKSKSRRSGGCAGKGVLTWGDLASCLKGQRRKTEREVSRGRSSQDSDEGPNEKESQKI